MIKSGAGFVARGLAADVGARPSGGDGREPARAVNTERPDSPSLERFAVEGAIGGIAVVVLALAFVTWLRYRIHGDPLWEAAIGGQHLDRPASMFFELRGRSPQLEEPIQIGPLECLVRTPSGAVWQASGVIEREDTPIGRICTPLRRRTGLLQVPMVRHPAWSEALRGSPPTNPTSTRACSTHTINTGATSGIKRALPTHHQARREGSRTFRNAPKPDNPATPVPAVNSANTPARAETSRRSTCPRSLGE